jgi:flagellum-specific peptidoglycan hydrolase FlgJ
LIKLIVYLYLLSPTPERVYNECVLVGMQHSEIVTKQFIIETGWGKHYIYNNIFGIYDSHKHRFKRYNHWKECVADYKKLIQDAHYKGGDYFVFLECMWKSKKGNCKRYAQDPRYIWKLKHISLPFVTRLKKELSPRRGQLY